MSLGVETQERLHALDVQVRVQLFDLKQQQLQRQRQQQQAQTQKPSSKAQQTTAATTTTTTPTPTPTPSTDLVGATSVVPPRTFDARAMLVLDGIDGKLDDDAVRKLCAEAGLRARARDEPARRASAVRRRVA